MKKWCVKQSFKNIELIDVEEGKKGDPFFDKFYSLKGSTGFKSWITKNLCFDTLEEAKVFCLNKLFEDKNKLITKIRNIDNKMHKITKMCVEGFDK